jgi:hypothetical protein
MQTVRVKVIIQVMVMVIPFRVSGPANREPESSRKGPNHSAQNNSGKNQRPEGRGQEAHGTPWFQSESALPKPRGQGPGGTWHTVVSERISFT